MGHPLILSHAIKYTERCLMCIEIARFDIISISGSYLLHVFFSIHTDCVEVFGYIYMLLCMTLSFAVSSNFFFVIFSTNSATVIVFVWTHSEIEHWKCAALVVWYDSYPSYVNFEWKEWQKKSRHRQHHQQMSRKCRHVAALSNNAMLASDENDKNCTPCTDNHRKLRLECVWKVECPDIQ